MARYDDDLRFAHVLADNADDITTRRFRALDLRVDTKPDLTPVSDADQAAEESLRNVLRRSRPRDAVLGEETGRSGSGPRCWVIDPIDGTKNYVRGVPVWATLICGLAALASFIAGFVLADIAQPAAFSPMNDDISDLGALTASGPWFYNQVAANLTGILVLVSPSVCGRARQRVSRSRRGPGHGRGGHGHLPRRAVSAGLPGHRRRL